MVTINNKMSPESLTGLLPIGSDIVNIFVILFVIFNVHTLIQAKPNDLEKYEISALGNKKIS